MSGARPSPDELLARARDRVERALDELLSPSGSGVAPRRPAGNERDLDPDPDPGRLRAAMRYATTGGKRVRPALTYAAAEAMGAAYDVATPGACAVELVHAYSLVHDDLPAMDDDVERRGRPTVHVEFGEWAAILAGDALLTRAFEVLAEAPGVPADRRIRAVAVLARRAGVDGMVGGQAMDLALGQDLDGIETLERVHALKTGALYAAAAEIGALLAGAADGEAAEFGRWGLEFGIAFQHVDDALDDDQPALRETAHARVQDLAARCREFAQRRGSSGAALAALADWIAARSRAHRATDVD